MNAFEIGMSDVTQKLRGTNAIALEKTLILCRERSSPEKRARQCKSISERMLSALETVKPLIKEAGN